MFILDIFGAFISILIFYFISKLFNTESIYLKEYGGRYFPFVFIGLAVNGYFMIVLRGLSSKIRGEQLIGTLEAMLSTPITYFLLISGLTSWNLILGGINILIYITMGTIFFNLHFNLTGFLPVLLVLILGMISLGSLGIISASFILYFKRGDPVAWLTVGLSGLLSGVYFPVKMFPSILQRVSNFIPQTYVLKVLRFSLLQGYSFDLLKNDIIILALFCIVLAPVSLWVFSLALKNTLKEGLQVY